MIWILIFISFILGYMILPTIFIRKLAIGIHKRGPKTRKIALTFDDGPDPVYTRLLLDVLKKHQAKATFFVVGAKVQAHPDIVKEIHSQGHVIGIHNYYHYSNWLLPPILLRRQLKQAESVIEEVIGERPTYYRPPWGHFNLFSLLSSRGYETIMWSAIPGDWKQHVKPEELATRLKDAREEGAIITLHDSGDTLGADLHAPRNTVQALDLFLSDPESRTYQFVTIPALIHANQENEG
ncbi:peptidoglycan/xylan/chitin deacetylase (PgdA/CDA1 family) [Bacillus ectoiniformans]|uniref:polysaccharide deacetylase family protein n=1 Tax=Bacillus ectoiniformans TaxID=1494429 RepID=UPI001EF7AC18|nr:polysaccharide deacetylase family protein [Bacillus ectoiniformans]MBM7649410.1 peptidoglycan/xylan/chitin deacetylase (PgdA/CDA1 family) [Bacillus ectoiniformans]